MIEKDSFLKKYNISDEEFEKTELNWSDLLEIYLDYSKYRIELEEPAIYLFNTLMRSPNVHSVRYRIKDSEHLIEKIIRKKIEKSDSDINIENYKNVVTDLIGLRSLHLFKDEWLNINDFIIEKWNCKQKPIAYYRDGDAQELIKIFEEKGCVAKVHKYGYRSVHYIIESQPAKVTFYAEIQVRTIFEEAWSEIDHTIRYPYDLDNVIFFQFLLILNRLAGSADEMGSYIKFLKQELTQRELEYQNQIDEKSKIIQNLESKVEKLNLKGKELNELRADIEKLKNPKIGTSIYGSMDMSKLDGIINRPSNLMKSIASLNSLTDNLNSFRDLGSIGNIKYIDTLNKSIAKPKFIPQKKDISLD